MYSFNQIFNILMTPFIQIKSITLVNFKNVVSGSVDFKNNILGVYGQNGSGKTALVDALEIFQAVARGEVLPPFVENLIMCGKPYAECSLTFELNNGEGVVENLVEYVFRIQHSSLGGVEVCYEQISEKQSGKRSKSTVVCIDKSQQEKWITPTADWEFAFSTKESSVKLEVLKEMTSREHRSLLFSADLANFVKSMVNSPVKKLEIADKIRAFAQANLFVIKNNGNGPYSLDFSFPFNFRHEEGKNLTYGNIGISLINPTVFPKQLFQLIENSLNEMNVVLQEIVPGLNVIVKNEGPQQTQDGSEGVRFELLSKKGDADAIPLRYESEGVKKIISILSILISVYNNPAMCLAVDEMDAGIYEYLLGEILNIVDEKAKGRLLFTSHNLRPLEMIKKDSLIFTTTNASNCYIRLSGIQTNNNPRNVYLRSISLGGQKEEIYQETSHFKIDRAFRKAGKMNDGKN